MMLRILLVVTTLNIFLLSCGTDKKSYTVEIIDDVRYIKNVGKIWVNEPEIELKLLRKYGGPDEIDDNYIFFKPTDIAKDGQGNLYVLDRGNNRIQKFDQNGRYVATIGREGWGPGEFMRPQYFDVDYKGNIYVVDGSNTMKVLNSSGKQTNTIRSDEFGFNYFRILDSGHIVMVFNNIPDISYPLIGVLDANFNILNRIGNKSDFGNIQFNMQGNAVTFTIDDNNNIYFPHVTQNKISKYTLEGKPVWQADRPLNFKLTKKNLQQLKQVIMTPVSALSGIDHKGRIWVETFTRDFSTEEMQSGIIKTDFFIFNIFDNNGVYLGDVPIAPNIIAFRIYKDILYMIDSEEMCVLEYKIIDITGSIK